MDSDLTFEEAQTIAHRYIFAIYGDQKYPCIIEFIQEEDFGWVFGYSVRDQDTGEIISMIGGSSPFFIDRKNGGVIPTPSLGSTEWHIRIYRRYRDRILAREIEPFLAFKQGIHERFDLQ